MQDNNGFTTRDILIRLETKVDKALDDHEQRIRALERRSWRLPATVLTSLIAAVAAVLVAFLPHLL